ncbi:MAG TPA: hypothetical protein VJZ76_02405 [Thermoanaerobaculia bacterium]|nr:hypothetical protein [Thermoanaerobaculia bacterium]
MTGAARAENDCGAMVRTMSRFRGTVRSVRPIASLAKATFMPVDLDPLFVAAIDVDGKTLAFGIHSPSHTFGSEPTVGHTFDLEGERMDCDGKFRRYLTLQRQRHIAIVETFSGQLEVGHRYRARVRRTPEGGMALVDYLQLPMHHLGGVSFTNPEAVTRAEQQIVFDVDELSIDQESEWQWISVYRATIVSK